MSAGRILTYRFFDSAEFFELLAESAFLRVPGEAAGETESARDGARARRQRWTGRQGGRAETTATANQENTAGGRCARHRAGVTYPMKSLDMMARTFRSGEKEDSEAQERREVSGAFGRRREVV